MLFLTYLLSPSLDIAVQVAMSSVHLAEGLRITRGETDWTFTRMRLRRGLMRKRGAQLRHSISDNELI